MRAVILLCLVAMTTARPQFGQFGFGQFQHRVPGTATGHAQGTITSGVSNGATITQLGASAGGAASGNAASSNSANASNLQSTGIFGNHQASHTGADSNQQTFGGTIGHFGSFRPGFGHIGK